MGFFLLLLDRHVQGPQVEQGVPLQHGPGSDEASEKCPWNCKKIRLVVVVAQAVEQWVSYLSRQGSVPRMTKVSLGVGFFSIRTNHRTI